MSRLDSKETEMDEYLDDLFQRLRKNPNDNKSKDKLLPTIFTLDAWYGIVGPDTFDFNKPPKNPQLIVEKRDNIPTLLLFSSAQKAKEFSYKFKIIKHRDDPMAVIGMKPRNVVEDHMSYLRDGIKRMIMNDGYEISFEHMRDQYYHFVRPYDFRELVDEANIEGNVKGQEDLWTAVFDLPKWFMVQCDNGKQRPFFYGKRTKRGDRVSMINLHYDNACEMMDNIKEDEPDLRTGLLIAEPRKIFADMVKIYDEDKIDGLIFYYDDISFGMRIDKILRLKKRLGI
jgi:hypothetical protein